MSRRLYVECGKYQQMPTVPIEKYSTNSTNVVSTNRCLSAVCSISGALSLPALSTSARHLDQTDIFFCLEMLMDHTSCPPGWKWKCDERQFFSGDRKKWQALEPRWRGSPNFSQFDTWLPIVAKGRVANFSQFCNFTLCDIVTVLQDGQDFRQKLRFRILDSSLPNSK